jgi:hypothetical protein
MGYKSCKDDLITFALCILLGGWILSLFTMLERHHLNYIEEKMKAKVLSLFSQEKMGMADKYQRSEFRSAWISIEKKL